MCFDSPNKLKSTDGAQHQILILGSGAAGILLGCFLEEEIPTNWEKNPLWRDWDEESRFKSWKAQTELADPCFSWTFSVLLAGFPTVIPSEEQLELQQEGFSFRKGSFGFRECWGCCETFPGGRFPESQFQELLLPGILPMP